jgi:probable phosphoglycerate mutase
MLSAVFIVFTHRSFNASGLIFAASVKILFTLVQSTSHPINKTIYLIRHGETDFNRLGIVQGSGVDTDLNETGNLQAQAFFKHYRHVPFDKIYVSSLKRTKQTVAPFIDLPIPIEIIPELNEINWGIIEGATPTPESSQLFTDMLEAWRNGNLNQCVEGGETPNELYARQQRGLQKIMEKREERCILICMHGRAMRSFLCLLTGNSLAKMDDFGHSNVCLYILEYREQGFHILLNNDTAHLNA